jgi:tetratricopeptide (TPR) repeat protein
LGLISDNNYQYDSVIYFYQKALISFDSVANFNNKAIILGNLGGVYNTLKLFEKSAKFHQAAILLLDSLNNKQQLILLYNNLSNALQNLQQYDSAWFYLPFGRGSGLVRSILAGSCLHF